MRLTKAVEAKDNPLLVDDETAALEICLI